MAKKIIIIDDNENSVTITKPNGQKENFDVEIAYKAEDFKENRQGQTLQQVIMPGVNELESSVKIETGDNTTFLPIVLVTTLNEDHELKTEGNYNAIKPQKFETLLHSINDVSDIVSNTIRKQVIATVEKNFPKLRDDIVRNGNNNKGLSGEIFDYALKATQSNDEASEFKTSVGNSEIIFRSLKPTDHLILRDFYGAISQDSIAFQSFQPVKTFSDESIHELTTNNCSGDVTIGAFIQEGGESKLLGFTHYKADLERDSAQFALLILDEWQTKGISTLLLKIITEIANVRGISEFDAVIYKKRSQVLPLFYNSGHKVCIKKESNVYKLNYRINKKWIIQHYKNSDEKAFVSLEDK
jgi:hypothetical protein